MANFAGKAAIAGILSTGILFGAAPVAGAQESAPEIPGVNEDYVSSDYDGGAKDFAPEAPVHELDTLFTNKTRDLKVEKSKDGDNEKFTISKTTAELDGDSENLNNFSFHRAYAVHADKSTTDISSSVEIDYKTGDITIDETTIDKEPLSVNVEVFGYDTEDEEGAEYVDVVTFTNSTITDKLGDLAKEDGEDGEKGDKKQHDSVVIALLGLLGLNGLGNAFENMDLSDSALAPLFERVNTFAENYEKELKELGLWDIYKDHKDERDKETMSGVKKLSNALEELRKVRGEAENKDGVADKDGTETDTDKGANDVNTGDVTVVDKGTDKTATEGVEGTEAGDNTANVDVDTETPTTPEEQAINDAEDAVAISDTATAPAPADTQELDSDNANSAATPESNDAPAPAEATPADPEVNEVNTGGFASSKGNLVLGGIAAALAIAAGAVGLFARRQS